MDVIAQAHIGTLDRVEQATVQSAAHDHIDLRAWVRHEFETVDEHFIYAPAWWQLAYTQAGQLVGYVQPVIFQGNRKGNLGEATLYYIGVVPEQRGHVHVNDLLAKAVAIRHMICFWQIYCDTDCQNFPMSTAFDLPGFAEGVSNAIWRTEPNSLIDQRTHNEVKKQS